MAELDRPIRMHLAVLGTARPYVPGMLVLYPDKLVHVPSRLANWCAGLGFAIVAVLSFALAHSGPGALGGLIGAGGGTAVGSAILRRQAPRMVAAGDAELTVIPLDSVTGIAGRKVSWLRGWQMVVSTLPGPQYAFRAKPALWSADLARALTARGRSVQESPLGIAVMSAQES